MRKKHINEQQHKVEGNQVLYYNGLKWLVRETLETNKKAKDRAKEMKGHGHGMFNEEL